MPHTRQSFDSSLRGTTSLVPAGASDGWTWCLTPRKALFFRRGAPRRWCRRMLRRDGRGASLPAKPYSFVAGHHVVGAGRCFGGMDVVPHTCQSLDLSWRGTTSLEPAGASEGWTWCLTPVKALIFRRGAPRRWSRPVLRCLPTKRAARRPAEGLRAALLLFNNLNKQYLPVRTESVWMPGCRSCSAHPESDLLPPCPWTAVCGTVPEAQRR